MNTAKQPWEKIRLTPNQEANVYMQQANHYSHKQMFEQSEKSYSDAIELMPDNLQALLARSTCKRNLAKTESALKDLQKCTKIDDYNVFVDQGICDSLYDLNQLENSIVANRNFYHKYVGNKTKSFNDRYDALIENFNDSLGDSLGPFILKNEKIFEIVAEKMKKEKYIETRPFWKQLRDENKCDVQSIPDIEEILLSPLERARRYTDYRIFLQTYFNKSWKDVEFLRKLFLNPNFLFEQSKSVTPQLTEIVCMGNKTIKKFLKMLQVRSPLYNEYKRKCPNSKVCERNKERYLYRVQYQTHRDMINILRTVRLLRSEGEIQKLGRYVESKMGDYVVLKTLRVMPWKLEFIYEVYNILGLAYTDRITIPQDLFELSKKYRLKYLLHLPFVKPYKNTGFVFGDRSTFDEPDAIDPKVERYKLFLERLKLRLIFTKYSIEKSYLYFEIARNHIFHTNYDESIPWARKALAAAKECNNYLWQFLSIMQIIKARAALMKLEYLSEAFEEARQISKYLNNKSLRKYIIVSQSLCEQLLRVKLIEKRNEYDSLRGGRKSLTDIVSQVMLKQKPKTKEEENARSRRGFEKWKTLVNG